jgi:hypothetical protein
MLPNYKFTSLDISNMYLNILITETKHILKNIMEHNFHASNTDPTKIF